MFTPVPANADFPALEAAVLEHWARHEIFRRSVEERPQDRVAIFYEGPPTANALPGVHHVWARFFKDLFCRYLTMRGHRVVRRAGWDSHGLAVEVEVEKMLGLTGKDQIEHYGVAEFVQRCRESVLTYVTEWERLTERMGYWVDMSDAYWTLDPAYVQSVWWHLRQLWDKGLLFEDLKVMPYCPRCGTGLSSHELGQPEVYREVEDPSVYVRFPLDRASSGGTVPPVGAEALAVWTTTPWTLVSNTAVAVHPDLEYVVVDGLVLAAARVDAVLGDGSMARATARVRGSDLVGLRYRRPFELVEVPAGADGWRVVAANYVTAEDGTGLVHQAPAFGAEDWAVGKAEGLPILNPVGPDGRFLPQAGWLAGRGVKEADPDIIDALAESGLLIRQERYIHSYPHCWRCRTALIYWGKPSWYVATSSRKGELIDANETVRWRPESVKRGRFGEWLENNVDWALSRDRYWGTPLPIWRCAEGHARCVASLAELSELAGREVGDLDPHRPAIDEVVLRCPDCGGEARRVEPVIDAWFDSGSMPAAEWGYPAVAGSAEDFVLPAEFIAEAVDQTRGWFYSLLAVNQLVHGRAPYKTVLCLGHIVDADGRKMSKSIGNVIDPWEIFDTRGADPLRWWMYHQGSPWTATRTSMAAIDASTSDTLMTLWNTWSFFTQYALLSEFDPEDPSIPPAAERSPLDRWALSRLASTTRSVTAALDDYQPLQAANVLAAFVDDLSNWFVRRSRRRFWRTDPGADPSDSLAAYATLHTSLLTVARLLAPACPFYAETIWRSLAGADEADSVHLQDWPEVESGSLDEELERQMEMARRLVSIGRAARAQSGVKVRQPLRRALVVVPGGSSAFVHLFDDLIRDELNVDELVAADDIADVLAFELVPSFRLLGPRLGEAVKEVRPALAALDPASAVDELEREGELKVVLSVGEVALSPAEVEVRVRGREGFAVSREGTEAVALDLTLDDDLRRRGLVRDVIRQVQELRRATGLAVEDRIQVWLSGLDDLEPWFGDVGQEVLAVKVQAGSLERDGLPLETDDGRQAHAWIEAVAG